MILSVQCFQFSLNIIHSGKLASQTILYIFPALKIPSGG